MTALKWWLRIVGTLYLLEGLGITATALFTPAEYAAMWTSTTADQVDAIAVRGILVAGLPGTLTWVLLGALLWAFSRAPAQARVLVIVVVLWELLVWAPVDVIGLFNGFELGRVAALIAIHVAIGVSGIVVLRRATPRTAASMGTA